MKKTIIISISLICIVIAVGIVLWNIFLHKPNIKGYLFGYEKYDGTYDIQELKGAEEGTIDDIRKYPNKYNVYWIDMHIENKAGHYLYDLNSKLAEPYSDVWFLDPFTGYDFVFDFSEYEVSDWGFYILVKTDDMSESEIDELIRSIGRTIFARNMINAPVFSSNTIYFKE